MLNMSIKFMMIMILFPFSLFAHKLISIGSSVTETVIALGHKEKLVAIDLSSSFSIRSVANLPDVGYWLQLPKEGILAMRPDIVLVSEHAKPKTIINDLPKYGIKTVIIDDKSSFESTKRKIIQVATALNETQKAKMIIKRMEKNIAMVNREIQTKTTKPKVLFLFSKDPGMFLAAGNQTKVGAIVELAGGKNLINSNQFIRVSNEAILQMNPDVIIYSTHDGKQNYENNDIKNTNAMMHSNVHYMDMGLASGFTIRLDKALKELSCKIHGNQLSYCY